MTTPYNWADDEESGYAGSDTTTQRTSRQARPASQQEPPRQEPPRQSRATRAASAAGAAAGGFVGGMSSGFVPPITVNMNGNGGGNGEYPPPSYVLADPLPTAGGGKSGSDARHQGDQMISIIDRIEFRSERDLLTFAKAVNRLGRELHFMLSMRAEEIRGVLSTYKGKWYTFGASSRVKAHLVAMHLKVSAEAAKALGVGALKMAHAFDRHFVKPEQDAKRKRNGQKTRREFTIGDT